MGRVEITYKQLLSEVRSLAKDVLRDADAVQQETRAVSEAARDTSRVAEMIAAMEVSKATVASTLELSGAMSTVTTASAAYASAANDTAHAAKEADTQAQRTHGGIDEAVSRSPDHAGKSEWYKQE